MSNENLDPHHLFYPIISMPSMITNLSNMTQLFCWVTEYYHRRIPVKSYQTTFFKAFKAQAYYQRRDRQLLDLNVQ